MVTSWSSIPNKQTDSYITNGSFLDGETDWDTDAGSFGPGIGWSISTPLADHAPLSAMGNVLFQAGTLTTNTLYSGVFNMTGGSAGSVGVYIGGNLVATVLQSEQGGNFFQGYWNDSDPFNIGNVLLAFSASSDFDGSLGAIGLESFTPWNLVDTNPASWTDVIKALGTSFTDVPNPSNSQTVTGTPIGMLMALTREIISPVDSWTDVSGHSASWTNIPKAV